MERFEIKGILYGLDFILKDLYLSFWEIKSLCYKILILELWKLLWKKYFKIIKKIENIKV